MNDDDDNDEDNRKKQEDERTKQIWLLENERLFGKMRELCSFETSGTTNTAAQVAPQETKILKEGNNLRDFRF